MLKLSLYLFGNATFGDMRAFVEATAHFDDADALPVITDDNGDIYKITATLHTNQRDPF